ncbi:MAG: acyltransferase family protein [Janthinobacterium lividum]
MSAGVKEPGQGARVAWLDGLRGLAALQVVVLHYMAAFLPAIGLVQSGMARRSWEGWFIHTPLFFPFDGYFAVFIFFLLSGVALDLSFRARPRAVVQGASRRTIRLGIPMTAAVALGALLLLAWPEAHRHAAALTGSQGWLGAVSPDRVTLGAVLHQVAFEGMLMGYSNVSPLPGILVAPFHLSELTQSLNAPLWTMHVEFLGSLLVLLLVFLRSMAGRLMHALACIAVPVILGPSPLVLFVIGHAGATMLTGRLAHRRIAAVCGVAMLCLGVGLDTHAAWPGTALLQGILPGGPPEQSTNLLRLQLMCCAVLVFVGVALLPGAHALLRTRTAQWLGRMSFSLYLVHFPILFTVVSALFVQLSRFLPFGAAAAGASLVGVAITVPAAMGFRRWMDAPAVRLSRRVGARTRASVAAVPIGSGSA